LAGAPVAQLFQIAAAMASSRLGTGIEGAVDRYVVMTRATQQLFILTS
jgi:hypothetical protein